MTEHIPLNPQQLDAEKVVLLQTRKRDGSWVDTPVNIAVQGDRAYFRTPGKASKNKRLRNYPEVQVRPCSWSGKPTAGPAMTARARLLRRGVQGGRAAHRREVPSGTAPPGPTCAQDHAHTDAALRADPLARSTVRQGALRSLITRRDAPSDEPRPPHGRDPGEHTCIIEPATTAAVGVVAPGTLGHRSERMIQPSYFLRFVK